jgi:hypothetical protein
VQKVIILGESILFQGKVEEFRPLIVQLWDEANKQDAQPWGIDAALIPSTCLFISVMVNVFMYETMSW